MGIFTSESRAFGEVFPTENWASRGNFISVSLVLDSALLCTHRLADFSITVFSGSGSHF